MAPGNEFISYQAVDKIIGLIREAQCGSTFPTRVTPHADQITYQRCRNDQGVVIRKRMIKAGLDGSLFYEVPNAEAPIFVDGTNSSKLLSRIDNSVGVFNMLNPVEALFGALYRDLQGMKDISKLQLGLGKNRQDYRQLRALEKFGYAPGAN